MRRVLSILLTLSLALVVFSGCGGGDKSAKPKTRFVSIGTGGVTGVYYPVGGAIAKMLNDREDQYGIKATVEATGGSVFNINAVMSGDLDFGITQADRLYQAFNGKEEWNGKPQTNLRVVLSLHTEAVTLIASDPSGIKTALDMKGKHIAIGNPGSGNRGNAIDALSAYSLSLSDIIPEDLKPAECAGMLQDGRIDAYFYTVGHPNGSIKEAVAGKTPVHFVALDNLDSLIAKFPFYSRAIIDISYYTGVSNTGNVETFGVRARLVTSANEPEDLVYSLVKVVMENFDLFKAQHVCFADLNREKMAETYTAPLHPGAEKYFREVGLIKEAQPQSETE